MWREAHTFGQEKAPGPVRGRHWAAGPGGLALHTRSSLSFTARQPQFLPQAQFHGLASALGAGRGLAGETLDLVPGTPDFDLVPVLAGVLLT